MEISTKATNSDFDSWIKTFDLLLSAFFTPDKLKWQFFKQFLSQSIFHIKLIIIAYWGSLSQNISIGAHYAVTKSFLLWKLLFPKLQEVSNGATGS